MSTANDRLLERLTAADPASHEPEPGPDFHAAVRSRVHATLDESQATQSTGSRRVRRRVVLLAAVLSVMLATVSVGYAVLSQANSLSVLCVSADQSEISSINAISGDPIADCARHLSADDLDAYGVFTDDADLVVVAPDIEAAQAVVDADLRAAPDLMMNQDVIELRMALDDVATGARGCGNTEAVVQRAHEIAERYGDEDTVVVQRSPASDESSCAFAFLQGSQVTIGVEDAPETTPDPVYTELLEAAHTIHDRVGGACLSGSEARQVVQDAIAGTQQQDVTTITVNDDATADCARVHTNAYGSFEVTIYAPPDSANES